jgi:predicted ATPase
MVHSLLYTQIQLDNYRSWVHETIPLRPLNVMIGPNGSGKSTFLDLFVLLGDVARGTLSRAISSRGGIDALLSVAEGRRDIAIDTLRFELKAKFDWSEDTHTYAVELQEKAGGYQIVNELLSPFQRPGNKKPFKLIDNRPGHTYYYDMARKTLVQPDWDHDPLETALAQVPKTYRTTEKFRAHVTSNRLQIFVGGGVDHGLRIPQTLDPTVRYPGPNGDGLISALFNLRSTDPTSYERILDSVRAGFPGFKDLDFTLVAAGRATLLWIEDNGRKFQAHQLSEGTLRFLWLSTLLLSPHIPATLLLDEPEISLHPELLMLVAGMLREASERSQVFVATHADRLVRWLEPKEILVVDKEDGRSMAKWADDPSLNLESWLADFTLDEVWMKGGLGGRP